MASIQENTQADFDVAEALVIDMLQKSHPGISLRRGTVLRELLVRPIAEVYAACTHRVDDSMRARSLKTLKESGMATNEEVDAILSNFSMSLYRGRNASGYLFVQVSDDMSYNVPEDTVFTSADGLEFVLSRTYVATSADISGDGYLKLKKTDNGLYYFLLPVEASEPGSQYEVEAGVRFDTSFEFNGLVAITSYSKFHGGIDGQTVDEAIDNLESAVSIRGFDSRNAIEATLLDRNCGNFSGIVRACSSVGYGDLEQVRDKSNVFGIATGGKVDIFVRTFDAPSVITFVRDGVWDSEKQVYVIRLTSDEVPGYYSVRSVVSAGRQSSFKVSGMDSLLSGDSFPVSGSFDASLSIPAFHSFPGTPQGYAFTAYRNVSLEIHDSEVSPELLKADDTKEFLVSVYAYPEVAAVQDYVDRDDVRSLKGDMVVRSAPICLVSLSAAVSVSAGSIAPDVYAMRCAVASYINSRSFVSRLTASEIVAVLKEFGISRVELMHGVPHGFKMEGRLRTGADNVLFFPGPDIDIAAHSDPANLISPRTVVFGANIEDIAITVVDDK